MNGLEFNSDSLSAFYDVHDANFPLNTPLHVQAVESNGWIITDGPDSELVRLVNNIAIIHISK